MEHFKFGELLPLEIRVQLANENLKIGSVLKFHCNKAKKEKRLILVGYKYDKVLIAFVHINTELNINIFNTSLLQLEHIPIFKDETKTYIDHNSFINCSDLIVRDKNEIHTMLVSNPNIHLGELTEDDLKNVKSTIAKSKVVRMDRKKEFGLFYP